jgi:hypothetical protein
MEDMSHVCTVRYVQNARASDIFNLLMVNGKVFLVPCMKINTKFKEIHAFPFICDLVSVLLLMREFWLNYCIENFHENINLH